MGLFPTLRSWYLMNNDTFQIMQGQFEPVDLTKEVGANFAEHTALNRTKNILQFLNQKSDIITFEAVMYDRDSLIGSSEDDFALLESWAKADEAFNNRLPILTFWVGTGWQMMDCVIESLSGIKFGRPTWFGNMRNVSCTVTLRAYNEFSLEETALFETRYHRARVRDYYEMLTYREYGNALLGDVIRKRHPTKPNIQTGDVIKLPSVEALRKEKVTQKSIPLQTAYSKKPTPQRDLRRYMFEQRNRPYVSHVIIED